MSHVPAPVILLIDNDRSFIYLIERYGQLNACRVISIATLDEARPLIAREWPALVVLHVVPPSLDGWAILRTLKADATLRTLPVVVCGAVTDAPTAWEAGVDCWLSKPVMIDDFRAVLATTGVIPPQRMAAEPDTNNG